MSQNTGVDRLLDDLLSSTDVQKRWALNPELVAKEYQLTETQTAAMISGDVERLIAEGLAERHVQEMRVSW
jgi:hypothetical protein